MAKYDREGPTRAHLIWIKVDSLLAEVVVWQHPVHCSCLCEDLPVCVSGGRGGGVVGVSIEDIIIITRN